MLSQCTSVDVNVPVCSRARVRPGRAAHIAHTQDSTGRQVVCVYMVVLVAMSPCVDVVCSSVADGSSQDVQGSRE